MNKAKIEQSKEIYEVFRKHSDFFPHIRFDYIQRRITNDQCVYQDGVIINYSVYKKATRVGTCLIPRDSCMLHQIANANEGNGNAKKVLKEFLTYINKPVWLSVRADNTRATKFYERNGFVQVGTVQWMNGTLAGLIYRYSNEAIL